MFKVRWPWKRRTRDGAAAEAAGDDAAAAAAATAANEARRLSFGSRLLMSTRGNGQAVPKDLVKGAEALKGAEDEDAQCASFIAYKTVIVDNKTSKQKQFRFKVKSSNAVILRLTLRGVIVLPRSQKGPPLAEFEYKHLKAVTIKDTAIDDKLKIITFEFEVDDQQCVASYATHQVAEIVDKLKVLMRKARYMGFV